MNTHNKRNKRDRHSKNYKMINEYDICNIKNFNAKSEYMKMFNFKTSGSAVIKNTTNITVTK